MIANNLFVVWDRITKEFIDSTWSIYQTGWSENTSDEEEPNTADGDFRLQMTQLGIEDLA
jgi:hypothetical protein